MREIKAATIRQKGGFFQIEKLYLDEPRSDEVLVRVIAVGHLLAPRSRIWRHEFLYRREDHAAARHLQQFAQPLPALRLHRHLAQHFVAALELAEELVVQVVAVGQQHQCRILHRRMPHDARGVEQHGKALAATLRVPDHARAAVAGFAAVHPASPVVPGLARRLIRSHAAGAHRFLDRCVHRMELMITGDDLVQSAAVRCLLRRR